jgi:hypothetical protein
MKWKLLWEVVQTLGFFVLVLCLFLYVEKCRGNL